MLNECLTVMVSFGQKFILQNTLLNTTNPQKCPNEIENAGDGGARQPKTRSPLDDIKIYGEVSFTYRIISRSPTCSSSNIVVRGRVDHAIGLILNTRFKDAVDKRRFYSLLLLVDAKFYCSVSHALDQLIVYLACLHQSRLQRSRRDASVYGLASDGYAFIFVKISHDGTVMRSRQLDILEGSMEKILGCLKHILEVTMSRSPKSSLETIDGSGDNDEVDESDPLFNLDDNKDDEEDDDF